MRDSALNVGTLFSWLSTPLPIWASAKPKSPITPLDLAKAQGRSLRPQLHHGSPSGSLESPHLPGPRHSSRNRASEVTARTAGRADEAAMAAPGGQEGNACAASRCAGGLVRGREGRRRAGAACVPIWAGPAGRARCHRAVSQESASKPCSPAAALRPRMLVMLAPPRTARGWAQRGGNQQGSGCPGRGRRHPGGKRLTATGGVGAGLPTPVQVSPAPCLRLLHQPGSLAAHVVLVAPR